MSERGERSFVDFFLRNETGEGSKFDAIPRWHFSDKSASTSHIRMSILGKRSWFEN